MPQLPLADDLYLTAHDTVGAKSRLSSATLGIGLSAALLGELIFWRRLVLEDGRLTVVDSSPSDDVAVGPVLEQLMRDAHHREIRDWIAFLATGTACELVERRLSRSGLVQRQERRRLIGTKISYVPRDTTVAGWPASRIRTTLERRELLDQPDLVLSGLMLATGLDQHVFANLEARHRDRLFDQLRTRLHVMLRELVQHAEAAVGDAVMTGRA
jgi:hypothetical protein